MDPPNEIHAMKSVDQIRKEITDLFGYFPPFFVPALGDLELLNSIWEETLTKYVKNKLPAFQKELLFAYLSKECGNSYCRVLHTCRLREFNFSPKEIKDLLTGFENFGLAPELKELLSLSLQFYKNQGDIKKVVQQLKKNLKQNYDNWVVLMSFIASMHRWNEGHLEEISYKDDVYVTKSLHVMLNEVAGLEQILRL
jgi:hypothetical protein